MEFVKHGENGIHEDRRKQLYANKARMILQRIANIMDHPINMKY